MPDPATLTIKCYRMKFGDVAVDDIKVPAVPIDRAKDAAKKRVLEEFNSDRFRSGDQPQAAALITSGGEVIATFFVRPIDSRRMQVVEV